MTIEDMLKGLKKWELQNLARQLNVTVYSGKNKDLLIDHIIDNANEQQITAALNADKKKGWWERHKVAGFLTIFFIIGTIATIIALYLTIDQGKDLDVKEKEQAEAFQSISDKLDQFDPIKRDQIVNQLKKINEELKTALNDEKSGNTEERKEAFKALKNGDASKAQELFKQRIEKDKNNLAENYKNLGNAYYVDLKFKKALESYNKAIEFQPDFADAWNNKGVVLNALDRPNEALEAVNKAIEIKPNDALAWNNKGVTLAKLGCFDEALKAFDKTIEIKPDYASAWSNKRKALGRLGRFDEAIQAYNKAVEIQPDDALASYNKGVVLLNLGRYEEALHTFNKAIEIQPDHANAWNNKGIALSGVGKLKEALDAFSEAIKIQPDHAKAWFNKGVKLDDLGRKDEALEAFNKAIEIKPDSQVAWSKKGLVLSDFAERLKVEISSPKNNTVLQETACIKGFVSDPSADVWVIVHPKEVSDYWVQPRAIVGKSGEWIALIYIGPPGNDLGKHIEIMAVANPKEKLKEGRLDYNDWPEAAARSDVVEVIIK